jgi:excisionase family DNA binding protein
MAAKVRTRRLPPSAPPPPERAALSVPEVAAILGCSQSMVWNLLRDGKLPRVRIGSSTRVHRSAVERFLEDGGTARPGRPSKAG